MAKRKTTKRKRAVPKGALRARVVSRRGGGATILFAPRTGAAKRPAAFRRNAGKAKKKALTAEEKAEKAAWAKHRRQIKKEAAYKAKAKSTPQYRTYTKKRKAKVRVAFGPYRRYRSPKVGLTYGYQTPKGRVRKIPAWAIAGAPSASAYEAGAKYNAAKERFQKLRMQIGDRVGKKFDAELKRQEKALEKLAKAHADELNKIAKGHSIMAPNKGKRKKGKRKAAKRKTVRAKRPKTHRAKRRGTMRRNAKKRTSARRRRTIYARTRTVTRRKLRRKAKMGRGTVRISLSSRRGKRTRTKRYTMKYKARRGARGAVYFVPPGARRGGRRQRTFKFTANGHRRRKYTHALRRRKSFRRNGTFSPFMSAVKAGAPVLGGFAGHRVVTGLLAPMVASYLPIPEAFKVPAVGVLVAIAGTIAAKSAIKGQTGDLVGVGMAVSSLHQLVMAGLNAAGQSGAASYLAGIPTQRTTAYGAYELINPGLSGLGSIWAARGNYLDVPSLGALPYSQAAAGFGAAYPEQAAAGIGALPYSQAAAGFGAAYPEQAAAGYGSYELTEGGVTLNGIGTSDAEIERALDVGDRQASVGFGLDTVGKTNITDPDGAYAPVTGGGQLPLVDGNFGGNVFGVSF